MNRTKKIFNKIFRPPIPVLITVPTVAFAGLIYSFVRDKTERAAAYIFYALSAYSLVILLLSFIANVRKIKSGIKCFVSKKSDEMPLLKKYLTDVKFKSTVGLCFSALIDALYTTFCIIIGILYSSVWFVALSIYHFFLGLVRLYLAVCQKNKFAKNLLFEYNCYRKTAWFIFVLNVPLSGVIILTIKGQSAYAYPGYVIYVLAIFTFYRAITSVINLVRRRNNADPIFSAGRVINFIAALTSVLGLQTAMISEFSVREENFGRMMNAITGGAVLGAVIVTAVFMLIKAYRKKSIFVFNNKGENDEQIGE